MVVETAKIFFFSLWPRVNMVIQFSFFLFIDEEQKKAYPVSNIAGKLLAYPALLLQ